jgi:hypothetical protein
MFVHVGFMLAKRATPGQNDRAFEIFFCPSGVYEPGLKVLTYAAPLWVFCSEQICAEWAILREEDIAAVLR